MDLEPEVWNARVRPALKLITQLNYPHRGMYHGNLGAIADSFDVLIGLQVLDSSSGQEYLREDMEGLRDRIFPRMWARYVKDEKAFWDEVENLPVWEPRMKWGDPKTADDKLPRRPPGDWLHLPNSNPGHLPDEPTLIQYADFFTYLSRRSWVIYSQNDMRELLQALSIGESQMLSAIGHLTKFF